MQALRRDRRHIDMAFSSPSAVAAYIGGHSPRPHVLRCTEVGAKLRLALLSPLLRRHWDQWHMRLMACIHLLARCRHCGSEHGHNRPVLLRVRVAFVDRGPADATCVLQGLVGGHRSLVLRSGNMGMARE